MKIALIDPVLLYGPLDALSTPLGGTETSIIALAEALQARGHEVHVYLRDPGLKAHQGVFYHQLGELRGSAFEVAVARSPEMFEGFGSGTRARIWWCHRSVDRDSVLTAQKHRAYPVLASRFQAAQLLECEYRGGFDVVPLGCRFLAVPSAPGPREPFTAAWISAFDRGLLELIGIWRGVRERLPPESRILVGGGSRVYRERGEHLATVEETLRRETRGDRDVEWLGPLAPEGVFSLLSRSGFFPYSAVIPESYCLAVLEAQAAGCLPIVTPEGALKERVVHGRTGWVEPLKRFGERIVSYCETALDPPTEAMRKEAREAAARSSWPEAARRFEVAIANCLASVM